VRPWDVVDRTPTGHTAAAAAPMPRAGANAVLSTTATFKLSLHPSAVADRNTSLQGARDLLDGMLMRHHDRLGGVLVSYDKPKLVNHADLRIVHMAGYVDVCVRAKVKVFTPKIGLKLVGRVNKIGVDHVGLLVHDVFNASLAATDLPRDFVHNPAEDVWESAEDGGAHRVGVGTECVFSVKKISEYDDVLHLIGSMAEEGTGALEFLGGDGGDGDGDGDGNGDARDEAAEKKEKKARKAKKARKEKKEKTEKKEKKEKKAKRDREEASGEESGKRRKKG
jgi:DNA-directed RNA polymerase I subunit RPA43